MSDLRINYAAHDCVDELTDLLMYCAEGISVEFEHWDDSRTRGPGLYFALIVDHDYSSYADPMGANTWPVDDCHRVGDDEQFYASAQEVAFENDGAVVVSVDGVIQEQMIRLRDLDETDIKKEIRSNIAYADWMGARHMSAIETSFRSEVVATVTLSEETGRVSVFHDGNVRTRQRDELGGKWREHA